MSTRNGKNKNGSQPRNRRNRRMNSRQTVPVIPYSPRDLRTTLECPDSITVQLGYPSEFILTGASAVVSKRFNTNSVFAPEVGVGTVPPGFNQWTAMYNQYRVIAYRYKFYCTNLETFPCYVYSLNSNSDPGTAMTGTVLGRPNNQFKQISGAGGGKDQALLQGSYTISRIVGQSTEFDDKYSALANANPADVTWLAFGAQTSTAANLTNGISFFGLLTMQVRFYDRLLF